MMSSDCGVYGSRVVKRAIINALPFWRVRPLPATRPRPLLTRGYDSDALRAQGEEMGIKVVIPPKSNRIIQYEYDKDTYRLRARVEQRIGKYKEYRRVATRYDKLAAHYLGFVILAAIRNILKTIC